jgi:hypothetical protein
VFPPNAALLVTVFATTVAWITTTLLTRPESDQTLVGFFRLVRPAGPGWGSIAAKAGVGPSPDSIPAQLLGWVLGCAFVYATLFGAGSALYGHTAQAVVWGFVWLVSGAGLLNVLSRLWRA